MLDKNAFNAMLALYGEKQKDCAESLGMTPATLSSIISGKRREFRRNEIEILALKYHLSLEDVRRIFFTDLRQQNAS